jgi:D-sedoheptulose 7-phosphate isomerase
MIDRVEASLAEAHDALARLRSDRATLQKIVDAGALLVSTFEADGRVFSCGNGGSMCDAMHFAEELTGRYRRDRRALGAAAISDAGHLTCVGNDYGYEHVFSRYVQAHGRSGDCLVAISTSGRSANVLRAAAAARAIGMRVIGLCGKPNAEFEAACTLTICTPAGDFADRVQELHIKVLHVLIEIVERHFFPENYA